MVNSNVCISVLYSCPASSSVVYTIYVPGTLAGTFSSRCPVHKLQFALAITGPPNKSCFPQVAQPSHLPPPESQPSPTVTGQRPGKWNKFPITSSQISNLLCDPDGPVVKNWAHWAGPRPFAEQLYEATGK